MPELPEVETIVRDLNKKVRGKIIKDVWTDWPKYFRRSKGGLDGFRKEIKNKKILRVWRLGKNIIFDLSDLPAKPAPARQSLTLQASAGGAIGAGRRGDKKMLIHQKMTGHLLIGIWNLEFGIWRPKGKGPFQEKVNGYIHVMFWLSGTMLALSDLRKFAKILIVDEKDFKNLEDIKNIGPDPLKPNFSFKEFKNLIAQKRGVIKKVLMDQNVISGIGNIYADDILFMAKIHPLRKVVPLRGIPRRGKKLSDKELKEIFDAIKKVLTKAVKLRGTSTSDYRDTAGKKGGYGNVRLVYQREGEKCPNKCGGIIKRIKISSRSAHFCPSCQKL